MNLIKKYWVILAIFAGIFPLYGERVVSLSPAVTELIIFAGGKEQLCGRSSACDLPETKHLPVVGDLGKPFPEAVLRNRATMVISDVAHPGANWQLLQRCRVKVKLLENRSIDDLPRNVRQIGKVLALPDADLRAAELADKVACLKRTCPSQLCPAVVILGVSPLISCGGKTFISSALELAGIKNIAAGAGDKYFIMDPEFLCAAEVEVLIFIGVSPAAAEELLKKASFRHLYNCRRIFLDRNKWSRLTPATIEAVISLKNELVRQ